MVSLLEQANVKMLKPFWIMSQDEELDQERKATDGNTFTRRDGPDKTLEGIPSSIYPGSSPTPRPTTRHILADWWYFLWGVGRDMELQISKEATYVSGATTYSAFQRDETVVKILAELDFAVKQPKAFVHGTFSVS
jgi:hypothetical protein